MAGAKPAPSCHRASTQARAPRHRAPLPERQAPCLSGGCGERSPDAAQLPATETFLLPASEALPPVPIAAPLVEQVQRPRVWSSPPSLPPPKPQAA